MGNLILIKVSDEIIIKNSIKNEETIAKEILKEFPNSNFFIHDEDSMVLYQYVKGFKKQFGRFDYLPSYNLYMFYIHDKYPEFFPYFNYNSFFDIDSYNEDIETIKEQVNKPIVIDKWKYKLDDSELFYSIELDPTHNQKYLNWIYKLVYENNFQIEEDGNKLNKLLFDFDKPQVKAYIKASGYSININDYEKDNDLFDIVNKCYYKKLEEIEAGDREILLQKRKVFEDKDWIVVTPKNHEEAVTLGRGTYWCTSADSEDGKDRFFEYTRNDAKDNNFHDLLIFIDKNDNTKKYQWSELTDDFLDWDDEFFNVRDTFNIDFIETFYQNNDKVPEIFKLILVDVFQEKYKELYQYYNK